MTFIQVPQFDVYRPIGGAEVVAKELILRSSLCHRVAVIHGSNGSSMLFPSSYPGFEVIRGFTLTDDVLYRGVIWPEFSSDASRILEESDLIISFERSIMNVPSKIPTLVFLGGGSYPHAQELVTDGRWTRLVVPSEFLARQVACRLGGSESLEVLPNGIDTDVFFPEPHEERRLHGGVRLLLPARPTASKGMERLEILIEALREVGSDPTVHCFDLADPLPGDSNVVHIPEQRVLAWVDHHQMQRVFSAMDLTLCLSEVEEGFGLAALESVACGTPVLASNRGNLPHLLPPGHGIEVMDEGLGTCELATVCMDAISDGRRACFRNGIPLIANRYSIETMLDRFLNLCQDVVGFSRIV